MNNSLIPTNGIWYKIKNWLRKQFLKQKIDNSNYIGTKKTKENNNVVKNENFKESKKQILANQLIYGEIEISELEETQLDEMIQYFTKDIQNIDNELLKIKQHILTMQKELKS